MFYVLKSILSKPLRRMTTTVEGQAAPAASSISRRLRELAAQLDADKDASIAVVAASLQSLAQELLQGQAAGNAGPQCVASAAVEQLERTFAAPAANKQRQQQQEQPQQQASHVLQEQADVQPAKKKQKRAQKAFDFSKYRQRYVALHVMYIGWDYHGFARQADTELTIEGKLFSALRKVKLIPEDVEVSELEYSRCGRTDKGVSALGQVIALKLRSGALSDQPLPAADEELDYPNIINRALPDDIRVLGWAVVDQDFNARFSALDREYKYFIVQDGQLDVSAMQQAAQYLVGEHDFRNFCKADVAQVRNFYRVVLSARIEPTGVSGEGMTVVALHIKGTAFLWHQVRCIAAVLLMVGREQEQPEIIKQLLDLQQYPRKPQYSLAAEEPLLLFGCAFDNLQWRRSLGLVERSLAVVGGQMQQHLIAAALTSSVYQQLQQQRREVLWQQQQQQQVNGDQSPNASDLHYRAQVEQQDSQDGEPKYHVEQQLQSAAAAAALTNGSSGGSSCSSRWLAPAPPHIPLSQRVTEPSIEERFEKAGIDLQLLNKKGLAAFV